MNSISNRQLTLLRKLNRKKYRHRERLFLIEGARAVRQVADNGIVKIEAVFFDETQDYWTRDVWKKMIEHTKSALLDAQQFAELSDTEHPQGVLALCRMPGECSVEELDAEEGVIIALDAIQDPGNLGTIIRTASWFGAAGMVSGKGTVDLFHPKVVRSTAGATGAVPYINGELASLIPACEELGWRIILLNKSEQSVPLATVERGSKAVIVVGNEAHGINVELLTGGRLQAEITSPVQTPKVESLNAAVAVSIALYSLAG